MSQSESPLDVKHLKKAVDALLTHVKNEKSKGKAQLLEDSVPVIVQLATSTIPPKRNKPYMIPLKHPLYDPAETQTCLITKDPQREYKDKIAERGITNIAKVIGISKLRNKFKEYEAKRQLCASYDLFLADDRVLPLLPHLVGKAFYQKKKQPLPVNLQKANWGEQFKAMLGATPLFLSEGSCTSVKAGHTGMTSAQLVDNIRLVVDKAAAVVPKQWKGVQAIHIKTHDSVALPLFHSLPERPVAEPETNLNKKRKGKDQAAEEGGEGASPAKKAKKAEAAPARKAAQKKKEANTEEDGEEEEEAVKTGGKKAGGKGGAKAEAEEEEASGAAGKRGAGKRADAKKTAAKPETPGKVQAGDKEQKSAKKGGTPAADATRPSRQAAAKPAGKTAGGKGERGVKAVGVRKEPAKTTAKAKVKAAPPKPRTGRK